LLLLCCRCYLYGGDDAGEVRAVIDKPAPQHVQCMILLMILCVRYCADIVLRVDRIVKFLFDDAIVYCCTCAMSVPPNAQVSAMDRLGAETPINNNADSDIVLLCCVCFLCACIVYFVLRFCNIRKETFCKGTKKKSVCV
jgi:hypothetical protein